MIFLNIVKILLKKYSRNIEMSKFYYFVIMYYHETVILEQHKKVHIRKRYVLLKKNFCH